MLWFLSKGIIKLSGHYRYKWVASLTVQFLLFPKFVKSLWCVNSFIQCLLNLSLFPLYSHDLDSCSYYNIWNLWRTKALSKSLRLFLNSLISFFLSLNLLYITKIIGFLKSCFVMTTFTKKSSFVLDFICPPVILYSCACYSPLLCGTYHSFYFDFLLHFVPHHGHSTRTHRKSPGLGVRKCRSWFYFYELSMWTWACHAPSLDFKSNITPHKLLYWYQ